MGTNMNAAITHHSTGAARGYIALPRKNGATETNMHGVFAQITTPRIRGA